MNKGLLVRPLSLVLSLFSVEMFRNALSSLRLFGTDRQVVNPATAHIAM